MVENNSNTPPRYTAHDVLRLGAESLRHVQTPQQAQASIAFLRTVTAHSALHPAFPILASPLDLMDTKQLHHWND